MLASGCIQPVKTNKEDAQAVIAVVMPGKLFAEAVLFERTHWLYNKGFYKKYKFISSKDREEKLEERTNYLDYIKPNMAIDGLTPYAKLMKIKSKKLLDCDKEKRQNEVMNKKLVA